MLQLILFAALALLGVSEVQVQPVSIVNMDTSREASGNPHTLHQD
jgi:hypothetical protein